MKQVVERFARFGLSAMFLYAAYHKLLDPDGFAADISHYRLLPPAAVSALAVALPPFELVVALGLCTRGLKRGSAVLCAAMLWTFAIAMIQAQIRGIDLDCGCFGSATTSEVGVSTIVRNLALGGLAGWVGLRHSNAAPTKTGQAPPKASQPRRPLE